MGFGTSYSISHVDCIDWVHTRLWKKAVRGVIGVGITVGLYLSLHTIKIVDPDTHFFVKHAMPSLLFSLFIYGLYPLLCQNVGLVDKTHEEENI